MPGYAAKKEIKENWAKLPRSQWTLPGSSFTVKNERLGNICIKPPNPRVAEFNVPPIKWINYMSFHEHKIDCVTILRGSTEQEVDKVT